MKKYEEKTEKRIGENMNEVSNATRERLVDVMAQLDRDKERGENVNGISDATRERLLEWHNWIEKKQEVKKG